MCICVYWMCIVSMCNVYICVMCVCVCSVLMCIVCVCVLCVSMYVLCVCLCSVCSIYSIYMCVVVCVLYMGGVVYVLYCMCYECMCLWSQEDMPSLCNCSCRQLWVTWDDAGNGFSGRAGNIPNHQATFPVQESHSRSRNMSGCRWRGRAFRKGGITCSSKGGLHRRGKEHRGWESIIAASSGSAEGGSRVCKHYETWTQSTKLVRLTGALAQHFMQ